MSASPDAQRRSNRDRLIWAAAAALIVVLGVGLAALIAKRRVDNQQGAQLLGETVSGGSVVSIGPLDGSALSDYLPGRQTALDRATGDRVAVISLDHYTTEGEARAAVGSLDALALLATPPGGTPSVVTGDMASWAQAQRADASQQRDQTQELLKNGVDDPDYRTFYQQEVARLTRLLAGIDPNGPVVFGLVVKGAAADLQVLAKHAGVRLVDVGPSAKVSDHTEYRGIRPEQTATVNQHDPRPF